jgi:hypothetical protein
VFWPNLELVGTSSFETVFVLEMVALIASLVFGNQTSK